LTYYTGNAATGTPLSGAPSLAGTYTVVANFAGSTDYTTAASAPATFTISPANGQATHFVVTGQPAASVTAGSLFSLTVTAEDSQGNVAIDFTGSETLALASSPAGGVLGGTITVTATSGVATFTGLALNRVGGYTVAVSGGSLASGTSGPISVTPGAATQLLITSQPPTIVTAGGSFGFTVTAEDSQGNVATGFNGNEAVALATNPGGSTLGGTLTVLASSGVATFSGLTLNKINSGGTTLIVNSGTLTPAVSNSITVSAPTAPVLAINAPATNYSTTFQSGGVAVENTSGVTIADLTNLVGASISIVTLRDGSNESLSVNTSATGITSSYNAATGTLTLSGSASVATYQSVLETVRYNDAATSPNSATRVVQFTVTDANGLKSNVAVASVGFIGTYTESGGPGSTQLPNIAAVNPSIVIDPNSVISAPTVVSATVAITSGFVSSTEDVLGLSSQFGQNFGITLSYPLPGEVVLTGTSQTTPTQYQLELDAITYTNTSHYLPPSDLQRTFTTTIYNGSTYTTSNIKTYNLVSVNTNPTVTTTANPLNYTALSGSQTIDPGLTVTDPDPLNITSATVSISSGFVNGQDTLIETAALPANVSSSYSTSTGVLTLSGSASLAQYETLLQGVAYLNSGLNLAQRTISYIVNSNGLSSNVTGNNRFTKVINTSSPTVARFDFNSGSTSTAPGFVGVGPSRGFSPLYGYGFSDAVTNFAPFTAASVQNLAAVSSTYAPMYEDGIVSPANSPQDFTISTTVGAKYDLRVYVGNPNQSLSGIQVTVYTGSITNLQQTLIGQSSVISTTAGGSNAFAAVEIDNLIAGGVTTAAGSEITVVIKTSSGTLYTEGLDFALHGNLPAIAHQDPAGGIAPAGSPAVPELTLSQLQPVIGQAIAEWAAAGIAPAQLATLHTTQFVITNLKSEGALALTGSNTVQIDSTADGYGWFVDPTLADQPAAKRIDLLTVVTHELGHILGLPDVSAALFPDDLMDTELPTGVRRLPSPADASALLTGLWIPAAASNPATSSPTAAVLATSPDSEGLLVGNPLPGIDQALAQTGTLVRVSTTDEDALLDNNSSETELAYDGVFDLLG
jgi:hypothetical protein